MKWLLVMIAVLFMVAPAMAGEDPYIAIVGTDCVPLSTNVYGQLCNSGLLSFANPFYFSPKQQQFMYSEYQPPFSIPTAFQAFPALNQYTRVGGLGTEQFRSQTLNNQPEVCHVADNVVVDQILSDGFITLPNARTTAGNAGFYEWFILLPKKPSGEINIVIECGVLKPNAYAAYGSGAIELCAAETGERVGFGTCVRQEVDPGVSPVINAALPKVTAIAYPGAFNVAFSPFHLTAWKNPSAYTLAFDGVTFAMSNNTNSQVLDGSSNARIILKACMDKTIVNKLPVTGQINALGETENDLEMGDLIYVRVDVPRQSTVDIYCHQQSVRLAGVGETPF